MPVVIESYDPSPTREIVVPREFHAERSSHMQGIDRRGDDTRRLQDFLNLLINSDADVHGCCWVRHALVARFVIGGPRSTLGAAMGFMKCTNVHFIGLARKHK